MPPLVLITREGAVTTATLNRPDQRNALNLALLEQLCAAIEATEREPAQRVFVLRGAGKVFCAGLDLHEAADETVAEKSALAVRRALELLSTMRTVTIAAVQGAAIAGGAGLMTACDFVVATADAKFGYPEIRRGIVPALVMSFLRRQVRERDARELLLLGERVDAPRAQAIGLINRVVTDAAGLETEIHALVSSVLQGAPEAVAETKTLFAELWPVSLAADLERAYAHHLSARISDEAREGIAAFNEKRTPQWARESERRA